MSHLQTHSCRYADTPVQGLPSGHRRVLRTCRNTLIAFVLSMAACSPAADPPGTASLSVVDFLGSAPSSGFARALHPMAFDFPRDHGQHQEFRNEWWYITGNLSGPEDREFGFQFTLFRNALSAETPAHPSRWATRQTFLAHVAITDVNAAKFYTDERFARGALGLAGVEHTPFRAWLEDWQLTQGTRRDCAACFSVELNATTEHFDIELHLQSTRPVVLHGNAGLSQKGDEPGNASYYYSFTRLDTRGELRIGAEHHAVRGASWMDHEWSTSSLQADQVGWDWFSLRLSDRSDLMLFQLRHRDDPEKNTLYGTFVDEAGVSNEVEARDIRITVSGKWISPASGAEYPAGWRIEIPGLDLDLTLAPVLDAQEMNRSFRYWEGAVRASGTRAGSQVTARGYVELTGY